MRLGILESGHRIRTKLLFAMIRFASRQPVPAPLKLVAYRPEFYGDAMKRITQEAMRGPSQWSVGERELMAAVVSKANQCDYCVRAHTATSTRALGDTQQVSAALADDDAVAEPLRATLRMLRKLVRERAVSVEDMCVVLAAGASRAQIVDALAVAFVFDVTNRVADAFGFDIPDERAFDAGAKYLLSRGYK